MANETPSRKPVASRPQGRGAAPRFFPERRKMKMPPVITPGGEAPRMEQDAGMESMGMGHMMPMYSPRVTVLPPIFNFPGQGQAPSYSPQGMGNMSAPPYNGAESPEDMQRRRRRPMAPRMAGGMMGG